MLDDDRRGERDRARDGECRPHDVRIVPAVAQRSPILARARTFATDRKEPLSGSFELLLGEPDLVDRMDQHP